MAKILLVEDNEFNRDVLSRRLVRRGWEVVHAVDGPQCLEMAATVRVDVIVMDMSLPGIDGWQLTQILKSKEDTGEVPIMALTAHAMTGDRERALDAGCDEFETKPVEFERLLEKLTILANRQIRVS